MSIEELLQDAKDIPGFEGHYKITADGRVFSKKYKRDWAALKVRINYRGYSVFQCSLPGSRKRKYFTIHRMLYKLFVQDISDSTEIDHINRQPADNRLENLRAVTRSQNCCNTTNNRVGRKYKGTIYNGKHLGAKWEARIFAAGKSTYLGSFNSELEAAIAYDFAALKYFGAHAHTNVIKESKRMFKGAISQ